MITIDEHKPVARWGQSALLNERGDVFTPAMRGPEADLPGLSGPEGSEALVLTMFARINKQLSAIDMTLNEIRVDARGSWSAQIFEGPTLRIGRENIEERITRFVHLVKGGLAEQLANADTIDLRYSNGISVSNKSDATDAVASR